MKRKFLLIPALALLLASCSSDEPAINDGQQSEYAAATSYLNINLRPSNGMGPMGVKATRADNSYSPEDNTNNGTYEDGTPSENNVTRVRFYFFNAAGAPFAVRQNLTTNQYDNFVDWYPNSTEIGGSDHDITVESTLTATLGLTFTDNDEKPAEVLAIANPTDEILFYNNTNPGENMSSSCMSRDQLKGIVTNYLPYADNNFVMSNSVYVDDNDVVITTDLEDTNFQSTPTAAAQNPVTIYIERVLARVDFGITMQPATLTGVEGTFYSVGSYTLNDGADGEDQVNEPIYVKFLGWNVTSTTATSNLIKDINPAWTEAQIMGTYGPWSTSDYHRSFWALNPQNVQFQFGNFGTVTGEGLTSVTPTGQVANSLPIPAASAYSITYLQENANPYSAGKTAAAPTSPSKVIIAAQLVDKQGKPLTICEWGYNKYTLSGLKKQLANALPNLYYQTTTDDGEQAWAQIEPDMLTFTTVDPIADKVTDKEYYVYAVLTQQAQSKTWDLRNGEIFTTFTSQGDQLSVTEQVNQYIRGITNHAMIWNTGLTYYFFDIEHLANSNKAAGYVGIVRNHIYRTTVTGIKGLGTPVYNPDLVIHPEVTNPEETVIAAKINILSWRLVTSSYELNWE